MMTPTASAELGVRPRRLTRSLGVAHTFPGTRAAPADQTPGPLKAAEFSRDPGLTRAPDDHRHTCDTCTASVPG